LCSTEFLPARRESEDVCEAARYGQRAARAGGASERASEGAREERAVGGSGPALAECGAWHCALCPPAHAGLRALRLPLRQEGAAADCRIPARRPARPACRGTSLAFGTKQAVCTSKSPWEERTFQNDEPQYATARPGSLLGIWGGREATLSPPGFRWPIPVWGGRTGCGRWVPQDFGRRPGVTAACWDGSAQGSWFPRPQCIPLVSLQVSTQFCQRKGAVLSPA
jgi:hypothetical protein